MGRTLTSKTQAAKVADVVEVKHHKGPIMLPDTMQDKYGNTDYDPAIEALMQAKAHASQTVVFQATIKAFPWEVSIALMSVLEEMFGSATLKTKMTFFGPMHPAAREVKVGVDETRLVPWGAPFNVPGLDGVELNIGGTLVDGLLCTQMQAEVSRKNQTVLEEIAAAVRKHIAAHSIYQGKALTMTFDGETPTIDFLDLRTFDPSRLNYKREVQEKIDHLILGYIRQHELMVKAGIRAKRGALFAGPYGTGKTALARLIMQYATQYGWTPIYLKDLKFLEKALPYVERFGKVLMFGEDLDKIAGVGASEKEVQKLSLVLDGVENYKASVFVICTTNNLDHVHPMLRRDGRFDITLPIDLPDAETSARLLKAYAGDLLKENVDLSAAGKLMAGLPPATSEEVVNRAKAVYISRTGNLDFRIDGQDMAVAAASVRDEKAYSQRVDETPRSKDELFGYEVGKGLASGIELVARLALARTGTENEDFEVMGAYSEDEIAALLASGRS